MPRFLLYMRIAYSATCLIACVLLIVLWVRSYWRQDILQCGHNRALASNLGCIEAGIISLGPAIKNRWIITTAPRNRRDWPTYSFLGFGYSPDKFWPIAIFPNWALTILLAIFATAPWIRYRFSLRTLLIATTLVAVMLGLVVCLR